MRRLGIGRRGGELRGTEAGMEVILIDDDRVFCVGVFIESVGKEDPRAEVHVASPEVAEFRAAEAHVLEPFCGGLLLGDDLGVLRRVPSMGGMTWSRVSLIGVCDLGIEVDL